MVDLRTRQSAALGNPLDLMLCPGLNWGCRFLRVDHRTLVDKVRDEKALGVLRMNISNTEKAKAIAAIEGVFLRDRSLRFAVMAESRLYVADLRGADLSSATLSDATLSSADLSSADLSNATLSGADLSSATLSGATLSYATLTSATLSGADLSGADLSGANLRDAKNLTQAQLDAACGEPPKLAADSGLQWDAKRPCPEEPVVAPPLNQDATP